jgi:hypothetical protein
MFVDRMVSMTEYTVLQVLYFFIPAYVGNMSTVPGARQSLEPTLSYLHQHSQIDTTLYTCPRHERSFLIPPVTLTTVPRLAALAVRVAARPAPAQTPQSHPQGEYPGNSLNRGHIHIQPALRAHRL